MDLKDKKILITGGDGFLGTHIRRILNNYGAIVFSTDTKNSASSSALEITDINDINRYVDEFYKSNGQLDGLVNNAAVSYKGNDGKIIGNINKTMNVNICGTNNCLTCFDKILAENASVVNVASIYGMLSPNFKIYYGNEELYNSVAYGASKAAIIQMTKYYAALWAPRRVNTVSPGGIFQGHADKFSDNYSDLVPLKRMAKPEEIVNAIVFLLSPMSSYITGHNLVVDGGLSVW